MRLKSRITLAVAGIVAATALVAGCGGDSGSSDTLTVYSGREEEIVAPLFTKFTDATGVKVDVRYGGSAELAAQIAEEGDNSPADVFFSQDAGSLGSVAAQLAPIAQDQLDRVDASYRDADGRWVGTSGRVRVVVYNTDAYTEEKLPDTVREYAKAPYASRLGIAPSNASFQAFITAMRLTEGDAAARAFLEDLKKNGAKTYDGNRAIVEAVAAGEIDLGLVNHYYLALVKAETPDAKIANKFLKPGDPGALVNVAGVGILASTDNRENADRFVEYLLSDEGQRFYATDAEENEYPLVEGIPAAEGLPPLDSLTGDAVPLGKLGDEAKATLDMIAEVGLTS